MPKIPSIRQGQRINQGTPVTAISTSSARRGGAAIGQFGQSVSKFGGTIAAYEKEKRRVDEAAIKADARAQAELMGQEGTVAALTNESGAEDGSSLQKDFSNSFVDGFKNYVEGIEDEGFKQIAIREGNAVQVRHRAKLRDQEIKKHNEFKLKQTEEVKTKWSIIVQNDPSKIFEALDNFEELAINLPYGTENDKIQKAGGRDMLNAAIQGLNKKGEFETVRKAMSDPRIAKYLNNKERTAIVASLENEKREFFTDKYNQEARRLGELKREQAAQERKIMSSFMTSFSDAESPEEKMLVKKNARRLVDTGQLSLENFNKGLKLESNSNEFDSAVIVDALYEGINNGDNYEQVKRKVLVGAELGLRGKPGFDILKSVEEKEAREKRDPRYKSERKAATARLNSVIVPSGRDAQGNAFWGAEKNKARADVLERISQLERAGMYPIAATKVALGEKMGRDKVINITGVPPHIQNDAEKLSKLMRVRAKKFNEMSKRQGGLSPDVRVQMERELQQMEDRINAMGVQGTMDELLKVDSSVIKMLEKADGENKNGSRSSK